MSTNSSFTSGAKQFKDPVYGYIALPSLYAEYLVDTQKVQRIKGVAQTGIRSVFAAATHDRFCHSLGVYKFGNDIFTSLRFRLDQLIDSLSKDPRYEKDGENKIKKLKPTLKEELDRWKVLLDIACLTHDIGHPVQSHGFEFLLDDMYLDCTATDEPLDLEEDVPQSERKRIRQIYQNLQETMTNGRGTLKGNLSPAIVSLLRKIEEEYDLKSGVDYATLKLPGNPHERMSVLYLLTDTELQNNIKDLIKKQCKLTNYEDRSFFADLVFICRMIIGWEYAVYPIFEYSESSFLHSIQNCIIHILNGVIDADGMDYLMRNAYSAGYDTSKVDYDRLCGAVTVYENSFLIYPAFSKSALSALEGYIAARNFEPKWLYSHHKVVYADLLTKQMYKFAVKYIAESTMLAYSIDILLANAELSRVRNEHIGKLAPDDLLVYAKEKAVEFNTAILSAHMQQWLYPFYTYLLAPMRHVKMRRFNSYQMVDADFDAVLHSIYADIRSMDYATYKNRLIYQTIQKVLQKEYEPSQFRTIIAEQYLPPKVKEEHKQEIRHWIENGDDTSLSQLQNVCNNPSIQWERFVNVSKPYNEILTQWLDSYQTVLSKSDFLNFKALLVEKESRKYKTSLWKSYAEYRLFLNDCAHDTGLPSDRIHRYLVDLITNRLEAKGFSIFEGKSSINPSNMYKEQFYYVAPDFEPITDEKHFDSKYVKEIFSRTDTNSVFFDRDVVVKFYRMKFKSFDKLELMFRDRVVNIREVLDLTTSDSVEFPYIFFYMRTSDQTTDGGKEKILEKFKEKFLEYCKEKHESEAKAHSVKNTASYVFRDSVHGDISLPQNFYKVVCTKEFQRLRRIKQLATADQAYPGATHTRFSHSLGTWYVMTQILLHFESQFNQFSDETRPTYEEKNALLLAALLHDLGHGPYSHAFEEIVVHHWNHEKQAVAILEDKSSEIHQVIQTEFGEQTLHLLLILLKQGAFSSQQSMMTMIYRSLISSQLDADRIDYIMRDNLVCGMAYGHIDMRQIIDSMNLTMTYADGQASFQLCFDSRYLSAIDQFIYARYQMYRNVYHEPRKMLYERIFLLIMKKALVLRDALIPSPLTTTVIKLLNDEMVKTDEFIQLDDEAVDAQIRSWASGAILTPACTSIEAQHIAEQLQTLCRAFLGQGSMFERIDLGENTMPYDQLAKQIANVLGITETNSMHKLSDKLAALIFIESNSYAYLSDGDEKSAILIRDNVDGTLRDYYDCSMFVQASSHDSKKLWESRYCCLFCCKKMMEQECKLKATNDSNALYLRIAESIEKSKPRKHIEIEKKYICNDDTLRIAETYLEQFDFVGKSSDKCRYSIEFKKKFEQCDTYYDIVSGSSPSLQSFGYSFRIRQKQNGKHIFSIKGPVKSTNYSSEQQVARYEYEKCMPSDAISDEVVTFVRDSLDASGRKDLIQNIHLDSIQKLLIVKTQRTLIRIFDNYRNKVVCEFCLDHVEYQDSNQKAFDQIRQIEIELLDEPEYWYILNMNFILPFESELQKKNALYHVERKSKLDIGLERLPIHESVQ